MKLMCIMAALRIAGRGQADRSRAYARPAPHVKGALFDPRVSFGHVAQLIRTACHRVSVILAGEGQADSGRAHEGTRAGI